MASPATTQSGKVAADEAQVPIGKQVLGVAGRVGHVPAAEHPADVRVAQAAQRPTPAGGMVDVGAVRVAGMVGEAVVLAVGGDPFDHGPFDRRRAEHGQSARSGAWS